MRGLGVVNTFLLVRCGGGCWSLLTTYVRIIGPIWSLQYNCPNIEEGELILIQGMTPPFYGQGTQSHVRITNTREKYK